jgi:hypothetical protein
MSCIIKSQSRSYPATDILGYPDDYAAFVEIDNVAFITVPANGSG